MRLIFFLILSTSFSVPLRFLDAIQSFQSRYNTIFQDILKRITHYLGHRSLSNNILYKSDTKMQYSNPNKYWLIQLMLLLYNQKMVEITKSGIRSHLQHEKLILGHPGGTVDKNLPARDMGVTLGPGRFHMPRSN